MDAFSTLPELFEFVSSEYASDDFLNKRVGKSWKRLSVEGFAKATRRLALGLHDLGVRRGESVAILAQSSPEWIVVDLAIMICGGVTVPVFKKISPESLEFELSDAAVRFLFLGDSEEQAFVREHGKTLEKIIAFNEDDPGLDPSFFRKLIARGAAMEEAEPGRIIRMISRVKPEDIASVVYTSGSTGLPKGVELTQGNIVSQVLAAAEIFPMMRDQDIALSALPLAHVFERMVVYFDLSRGVPVWFADNVANLGELMLEVRPTVMTVVPRILEKVHAKIKERVDEEKGLEGLIARAAFRRAESRKGPNPLAAPLDRIYEKLVYSKFAAAFGGRLKYLICGASALSLRIARFVENLGAPLYEGYGLTEAAPVLAVNGPGASRTGSVGKPYPGVSVRISDEGEILAKGPNVMRGYHNNPEATRAVIDEERGERWLRTGDLGIIDADGFLTITGRKKELFKKSTGEYVPPIPIEQAISRYELVDAAMVIADGREMTTCLVFPDFEKLPAFKARHGFAKLADRDFLESQWLKDDLGNFIEGVNSHLHHCEKVRKFAIIESPVSVEGGELTPTLKIRRSIIEKKYKAVIDGLYEGK